LQLPLPALFQAISDPSQTSQWWGQKGLYRINNVEADVRPGGTWISRGTGADGKEFSVRGKYLQVDPPRLLVHTWNPSYSNLQETVVRCELEPREVHGLNGYSGSRSPFRICRQCRTVQEPRRRLDARARMDAGVRGARQNNRDEMMQVWIGFLP
jgi:hypothetical protein